MAGKECMIHLVEVKSGLVKRVLQQDGETRDSVWLGGGGGAGERSAHLARGGIRRVAGGGPGQRGRAGPKGHSERPTWVRDLLLGSR